LRDAQSTDGNIITALRDKTEVSVADYDPAAEWLYVTANGYSGWVKREYLSVEYGGKNSNSPSSSSGSFVLKESNTHYLEPSEYTGLSPWELFVARNEIYARHGRGFNNEELRAYFSSQNWYTELYSPEEFDTMASPLNDFRLGHGCRVRFCIHNTGIIWIKQFIHECALL
jgi:hypothetical protein